jgi:glycosyltransferase involved in cell wall biosynthesis
VATGTAVHLARAGHDVVVLSPAVDGLPARESVEGVELRRVLRRGRLPQSVSDVAETARWARTEPRPDVLVSHQATVATGLALAHRRVPLLHVFHASAPLEERFIRARLAGVARARGILLDPLLVALERVAVRHARVVAVLSEFSAGIVRSRHPGAAGRIVRVGGGLDAERFAGGDPARGRSLAGAVPGVPFVLTVRRLEPRMGVEELVRATALLAERECRVHVAVAGAGAMRGPLERLAADLGVADRVRFLGRVPDDDLPDLYAGADLFALPTVAYEGFGISTVEALAAGTPVVGTPVGATPELLAPLDERLVADGTEPAQLAAAIERAVELVTTTDLAERSRRYAHGRFTWEVAIESWLAALAAAAGT